MRTYTKNQMNEARAILKKQFLEVLDERIEAFTKINEMLNSNMDNRKKIKVGTAMLNKHLSKQQPKINFLKTKVDAFSKMRERNVNG